ncbi:MAG: GDSL family lipase [Flammeovirgaceae bacterium]|nr:GDSL family lipase [Flammeovirgaceae bacterium]
MILNNIVRHLFFFIPLFSQAQLAYDLYPSRDIIIKYHNDWTKKHYLERIEEFRKDPLGTGSIVFLGNSITEQGKDWGEKFGFKNLKNRGISGDVTDGLLARLDEIYFYKPKAIFVLIGLNDLWNFYNGEGIPSRTYIGNNIFKIIKKINVGLPETLVFVQTILPTRNDFFVDDIIEINKFLKRNDDDLNFQIIDLHSSFVDSEGLLKIGLTYDDAHLNKRGYDLWVECIKHIVHSLQ